MRHGPGI